jgi:hypothetical protein
VRPLPRVRLPVLEVPPMSLAARRQSPHTSAVQRALAELAEAINAFPGCAAALGLVPCSPATMAGPPGREIDAGSMSRASVP